MVFACCFGGGGRNVDTYNRPYVCDKHAKQVVSGKSTKGQEFRDLQSGKTARAETTSLMGNTVSLSAVTSADSTVAYQLNVLSSALAGLSGSWYERVSSAVSRLTSTSGAAACSVYILGSGQDHFTVVHTSGMHPEYCKTYTIGSQLATLQAESRSSHPFSSPERRYNSMQLLQLLQSPLLYSFSDAVDGARKMKLPPSDWESVYSARGLSDFCALPLFHDNSVIGAVTLAFARPQQQPLPPQERRQPQLNAGRPKQEPGMAAQLMCCDEQAMTTLGLLLSVLLMGSDVQLAQQVADILAAVHSARNLQQVVTAVIAGVERVLQLQTRVTVAIHLALLPNMDDGNSGAGNSNGRAIFFEEQGAQTSIESGVGVSGVSRPRTVAGGKESQSKTYLDGTGGDVGENSTSGGDGCAVAAPVTGAGASSGPAQHIGFPANRSPHGGNSAVPRPPRLCLSMSGEAIATPANSGHGTLLWQAGCVQARALSLHQTLLANLPRGGTVVQDCVSYMQQVGSPKRDLYLLSARKGAPPFSLAIALALLPLKNNTSGGAAAAAAADASQLVLYAAVAIRLPLELLNEVLTQAQQLAVLVLAPLLAQKLSQAGLAEEWALLMGECTAGKRAGAAGGASASADQCDLKMANLYKALKSETVRSASVTASADTSMLVGGEVTSRAGDDAGGGGGSRLQNYSGMSSEAPQSVGGGAGASPLGMAAPSAVCTNVPVTSPALTSIGAGAEVSADTGTRVSALVTSCDCQAAVMSTAVLGAFAGDMRTHMGMLVSSFKETINSLQAHRADGSEDLSVLKLGKVLGRGGSGLVFQGHLHVGLEVAVKLFENPDDTDPDVVSPDWTPAVSLEGGSSQGTEAAAAAGASSGAGGTTCSVTTSAGGGSGKARGTVMAVSPPPITAVAQMTKRQRNLLRNALELGVTSSLSHPNIVQGYCHWVNVVLMQDVSRNQCWLMRQAEYRALLPPGSPAPPLCSALVMEYCDMGSLVHALKRGTFTLPDRKTNLEVVYMCLLEIALALRHLHTAKLAHCDLKPGNVLLRSSPRDLRGFVCKLGDFGYAAILKDGLVPGRPAVLPDEACGTLQYMAPELFVSGRPVDASIDIYAFGMLMWELISGRTPYSEGDYPSRSLMKAVYHGKRPVFPDDTLVAYKNLAMCCWSGDLNRRPTAPVLVKLLRQQLEAVKHHPSTARSASTESKT